MHQNNHWKTIYTHTLYYKMNPHSSKTCSKRKTEDKVLSHSLLEINKILRLNSQSRPRCMLGIPPTRFTTTDDIWESSCNFTQRMKSISARWNIWSFLRPGFWLSHRRIRAVSLRSQAENWRFSGFSSALCQKMLILRVSSLQTGRQGHIIFH